MKKKSHISCLTVILAFLLCFTGCDTVSSTVSSEIANGSSHPVTDGSSESSSNSADVPDMGPSKNYYCFRQENVRYGEVPITSFVIDEDGKEIMRFSGKPERPGPNPVSFGKPAEGLSLVFNVITQQPCYISLHTDGKDSLYDLQGNLLLQENGLEEGDNRDGYRLCAGDWVERRYKGYCDITNVKTGEKIKGRGDPAIDGSDSVEFWGNYFWFDDNKNGMPQGGSPDTAPQYIAVQSNNYILGLMDQYGNLFAESENWNSFIDTTGRGGRWFIVSKGNQYSILDTDFNTLYSTSEFSIEYLQNDYFQLRAFDGSCRVFSLTTGETLYEGGYLYYFDGEIAILNQDNQYSLVEVKTGTDLYRSDDPDSYPYISPSNGIYHQKASIFYVYNLKPCNYLLMKRDGSVLWGENMEVAGELGYGLWQEYSDVPQANVPERDIGVLNAEGNYVIQPSPVKFYSRCGDLYINANGNDGGDTVYDINGNLLFTSIVNLGELLYGDSKRMIWYDCHDNDNTQVFTMTDLHSNILYQCDKGKAAA